MRILFITSDYLNLYKDIEFEMIRQGHVVNTLFLEDVGHDPNYSFSPLKNLKGFIYGRLYNVIDKYWEKRIKNEPLLNEKYELLFVINGMGIGKYLIDYLSKKNPNLKRVYYTWDTTNYYRFDRLFKYFDRCYSFDLNDCKKYKGLQLLPIYYVEDEKADEQMHEYDVMMIGLNHDSRYTIVKKMMPDLVKSNIRYFIKVIQTWQMEQVLKMSLKKRINLFLSKHKLFTSTSLYVECRDLADYSKDDDRYGIKSNQLIEPSVYRHISAVSRCVLDTVRQTQSGLTARFMWALGNGKKIITTRVLVVDEQKPVIPAEFILEGYGGANAEILQYRIDNWVKTILGV